MKFINILLALFTTAFAASIDHSDLGGPPYRPFEHTKRHEDVAPLYTPKSEGIVYEYPIKNTKPSEHADFAPLYTPKSEGIVYEYPIKNTKRNEHADSAPLYTPQSEGIVYEYPIKNTKRGEKPEPLYSIGQQSICDTNDGLCRADEEVEDKATPEHGLGPYGAVKDSTTPGRREVTRIQPYVPGKDSVGTK